MTHSFLPGDIVGIDLRAVALGHINKFGFHALDNFARGNWPTARVFGMILSDVTTSRHSFESPIFLANTRDFSNARSAEGWIRVLAFTTSEVALVKAYDDDSIELIARPH